MLLARKEGKQRDARKETPQVLAPFSGNWKSENLLIDLLKMLDELKRDTVPGPTRGG